MQYGVLLWCLLFACGKKEVIAAFPENFVGVGFELQIKDELPIVVRTLDGGSAAEAGILAGDQITAIDSHPTKGMSLGEVVTKIRGQPNTQITLNVEREKKKLIVVVKRRAMAKTAHDYKAVQK